MNKKLRDIIFSILLVLLGNLIFAIAINAVVIPNHLGEGGITGFSLFCLYVFGWNNAIVSFVANVILLIIGWTYLEKRTIIYTLLSIVAMSLFLQYVNIGTFVPENTLVAPLVAGFLIGLGIGIVILGNGTTAGTDIIALIMNKYLGISVSRAFLILDILILIPLTFVIGLEKGVLTIGTLLVASQTLSFILEGFNPRKAVTIISNKHEEIATRLTKILDRGVTIMNGYGFYTKHEKHIIYIVINQRQLLTLQKIIHEIDPKAFVTVADIHQVTGEGFTYFIDTEAENPALTTTSISEP
ncbi:YitT family protein [Aerococcaceae bacterium zg-ZUI334]|uniref:YitT family protein n=1 Tax=Aerococcaceae bacterium zg-252 TaxID=2796928 RepID=UPI001B9DCE75|nr:YitT family protein [Aerococcaceae bacterium zg-ZUI334]